MNTQHGFGIVPRWMFGEVNATALAVYTVLTVMAGDSGRCWPSHASIADAAGTSVASVKRALVELREKGYVSWEARSTPSGRSSNVYRVKIWRPEPVDNSTETDIEGDPQKLNMSDPLAQYELDPSSQGAIEKQPLKTTSEKEGEYVLNQTGGGSPVDNSPSQDSEPSVPAANAAAPTSTSNEGSVLADGGIITHGSPFWNHENDPCILKPASAREPEPTIDPSACGGVLSPVCPAHRGVLAPPPCRACQRARQAWEAQALCQSRERIREARERERLERERSRARSVSARADPEVQERQRQIKAGIRAKVGRRKAS